MVHTIDFPLIHMNILCQDFHGFRKTTKAITLLTYTLCEPSLSLIDAIHTKVLCFIGIIALVNGNKNMESEIEAAYEEIIPAFRNFEAANMPKVCIYA